MHLAIQLRKGGLATTMLKGRSKAMAKTLAWLCHECTIMEWIDQFLHGEHSMRQSVVDLTVTSVGKLPILQAPGDAYDTHTIVIIRIEDILKYPGEKLPLSQLTNLCTGEAIT